MSDTIVFDAVKFNVNDSVCVLNRDMYIASDTSSVVNVDVASVLGGDASFISDNIFPVVNESVFGVGVSLSCMVLVVFIFLLYSLLLYRYGNLFGILWKNIAHKNSYNTIETSSDINIVDMFKFARITIFFTVTLSLYTVISFLLQAEIIRDVEIYIIPSLILILAVLLFYRFLIESVISYFSDGGCLIQKIRSLLFTNITFFAFVATPLVLVCGLSSFEMMQYAVYFLCFFILSVVFSELYVCFKLFIKEKVSFLQYILYFCIVEIVPSSFIVVYLYRNLYLD